MERKLYDDLDSKVSTESDSFLDSDSEVPAWKDRSSGPARRHTLWTTCNMIATALNACLFAFMVLTWHLQKQQGDEVQLPSYEFTKDAITMEIRPFDDVFEHHEGRYRGDPRPELDQAWRDLMRGYNVRVPPNVPITGATKNHSLVEMHDGSGDHYAVPAVLHELHCLRTMRQYLFPDYYPKTYQMFKPEEGEMIGVHIDHCFDILRQSSMCHADMTLLPLEWWDEFNVPQNVIYSPHKCANWDQLQGWAIEHSFDPYEEGIIPGHDHIGA